ncbi:MAG: ATP synthase F1 subunit delta [Planctomycetaceae bacterium]|nr:ATP synthase F1 subunit delta [Planctomycetaceae bacterium]
MIDPSQVDTRPPSVMEDPSVQMIARVYAQSFLEAGREAGVEGLLEEFKSFQADVLDRNPEYRRLLLTGALNKDDKLALIDRTLTGRGSEIFVNFLKVVTRHERLDLLPQILRETELTWERAAGKRRVQVKSAVELNESARQQIAGRLQETMGFTPILETSVDPGLLGGLVIRVGDTVYDSSLRSRLKQLRERFRTRKVHEIQSGRDRFSHHE